MSVSSLPALCNTSSAFDRVHTLQHDTDDDNDGNEEEKMMMVVGWLLNVPATCECISGMDLLRQFYVLPH